MKKAFLLSVMFAFLLAVPAATYAALPEIGGNPVPVTKCTQVGSDISVEKFGATYPLTTACRQTEYGYKFYTMKCTSGTEYYVSWKPCTSDEIAAVAKASCTEGDDGLDYNKSSWATGVVEGSTSMATLNDSCGNSVGDLNKDKGQYVAERNCSNGYIHTQWSKCDNGCSDGACLKEAAILPATIPAPTAIPAPTPSVKCTETDGLNYDVFGTATGNDEVTGVNGSYPDTCGVYIGDKNKTSGNFIAETHCSSFGSKNYVHTQWYNCPAGCVNGACQAKPAAEDSQNKFDTNAKTVITAPANNSILINYPRIVDLAWNKIDNANQYQVEVACDTCGLTQWASVSKWKTFFNSLQTPALAGDNQFRSRVLPLFPNGLTGQWSDYSYFSFKTSVATGTVNALPACSDVSGGNTNFIICAGFSIDHQWSGSRVKVVAHDGETANVELGSLSEIDADLVLNVPETFYVTNKPGKYLTVTYLGIGAEGRALIKVDSNTTPEDSYSDSCTNEKGADGIYSICKNKSFDYDGANFQFKVTKFDGKYVWLKLSGAKSSNVVLKINARKKYLLKKVGATVELTYLGKAVSGGAKISVDVNLNK